ncbi:MAG: 5'-nucleotidase [Planctomycetota bacterium]
MVPDAAIAADIAPVGTFVAGLQSDIIGSTSQTLIQGGSDGIRSEEKAVGNLVADAFFEQASQIAGTGDFAAVDQPDITLINGGGIRADIASCDISRFDTFSVSPFSNFVAIVEDVTREDLKLLLENAYSHTVDGPEPGLDPVRQGGGTGRFAQLSGLTVEYDLLAQALELNSDGTITTPGERIVNVTLDDGTPIVVDGEVQLGDTLDIATATFLANGGDQYFGTYLSQNYDDNINNLRITDQQALEAYIRTFGGNDLFSDFRYDNTPDGRIVAVPEPAAATALLGLAGLCLRRRRA